MKQQSKERSNGGAVMRRSVLALAITSSLGFTVPAVAQSTTGYITGKVPVASHEVIQITGEAGFKRSIKVSNANSYKVTVPAGTYNVTLFQNGKPVQSRQKVLVRVERAITVNFTLASVASEKNVQHMSAVTVRATEPAIDVNSTRQNMVLTAAELKILPLGHDSSAIALLAPTTALGAGNLGNGPSGAPLVSVGGNSVVENAYYINGFNTTDPVGGAGGTELPYFAIAQQQTITSGYGAEYGRSTGGVVSQVGKSGSDKWHAGIYASLEPAFLQGTVNNIYYNNPRITTPGQTVGSIYDYQKPDSNWQYTYDAFVSGPIIKHRLYFYLTAEWQHSAQDFVNSIGSTNGYTKDKYSAPKFYGKINWNINDNNILELTGIKTSLARNSSANYAYNYANDSVGSFVSNGQLAQNSFDIGILKYTSYITDNLTFSGLFGRMRGHYWTVQPGYPGYDPTLPFIASSNLENPALTGGSPGGITNNIGSPTIANPNHRSNERNLRLSLDWRIGWGHDIKVGIDNLTTQDISDGSIPTGPGYYWQYGQSAPGQYIIGTSPNINPWVDTPSNYPNGANGYYVQKTIYATAASVRVRQEAQYISDNWQVTPDLLLNLGLRNDQFTNYNPDGVPYVNLRAPQWAPRIGFSWNIFGDSSAKLYGNAGRYYLALPAGLAVREAAGSYYAGTFYTYSGINGQGVPTGLTQINSNPAGNVSANNEYGQPLDPYTVPAVNLKPEYEDQFILGFEKTLPHGFVFGTQGTYMKMGRIIDDVADTNTICNALLAQNASLTTNACGYINGSILINPGSTNTFRISNGQGGYNYATVTPQMFGFPPATRKFYALEFYLEHHWDGKWFGKIDYVFSRSYGSTEGPTQSATGQISSAQLGGGGQSGSITTQWDFGSLMQYADGEQANSHRHTIKAFGAYKIAPEWTLSGVWIIQSGAPNVCLGFYGPNEADPTGYATVLGGAYHWCGGQPSSPGASGHTPWIHPLSIGVDFVPKWASKHLDLSLQVNNVFNEQKATQYGSFYGTSAAPNPTYLLPIALEPARFVRLSATYTW